SGTSLNLAANVTANGSPGTATLTASTGSISGSGTVAANAISATALLGNVTLLTDAASLSASANGNIGINQTSFINLTSVTSANGNVNVVAGGTITATLITTPSAGGSVSLNATSGDVVVGYIEADEVTGAASIKAAGAITSSSPASRVIARDLAFEAGSGVGTTGTVTVSGENLSASTGTGGINITNQAPATVNVSSLSATAGSITYKQTGNQQALLPSVSTGAGDITLITDGATFGKGMKLGTLSATGNVSLFGGVEFTLSNTSTPTNVASGTLVLSNAPLNASIPAGTKLLVAVAPGYAPALGQNSTLFDTSNAISGVFNNAANGSTIEVSGIQMTATYTNDLVLTTADPLAIYVWSGWAGTLPGTAVTTPTSIPAVFGYNAFATIQTGVNQAAATADVFDDVTVYAGTAAYDEAVAVGTGVNFVFTTGAAIASTGGTALTVSAATVSIAGGSFSSTSASALVVSGGTVTANDGVYATTANADTIIVSGGSFTLRISTVTETSSGRKAAIFVSAASVDLGTAASGANAGGNTIETQGIGLLIQNIGANAVPALGNVFKADGAIITSNFTVEDNIVHQMDDNSYGLVTWVANNVYVTKATLGIQQGVDVVGGSGAGPYTVNIDTGAYAENVSISSLVVLSGSGSPTATSFTLNAGSNIAGSTGVTAPNVTVNNGSTINQGFLVLSSGDTLTINGTFVTQTVDPTKNAMIVATGSSVSSSTGATLNVTGNTITLQGGTFTSTGSSPAVSVSGGILSAVDATLVSTSSTAGASTVAVSGGSLSLRGSNVTETANADGVAVNITGGTVDLGNGLFGGGNTFDVNNPGLLISNTGASNVSALGNTFKINGTVTTDNFAIEDEIVHKMDNNTNGLVTWVANNTFVTLNTLGIQQGINVVGGSGAGPY
ncbi:MAG: hypothetical protein WCO99_11390, partial [Planctomycetota bacterium]